MKVAFRASFKSRLRKRIDFMLKHSPSGANNFQVQLFQEIQKAVNKPYQCRKSIFFDSPEIRDLVFKGHTITFLIKEKSGVVFGFKYF